MADPATLVTQEELELAPEIERRPLMEEQLCAVRGLQAPAAAPGGVVAPTWEDGDGAAELGEVRREDACELSAADGTLDGSNPAWAPKPGA